MFCLITEVGKTVVLESGYLFLRMRVNIRKEHVGVENAVVLDSGGGYKAVQPAEIH